MNLSVSMYSDKPIYEQLKEQIKKSIIQKRDKRRISTTKCSYFIKRLTSWYCHG